jgi:hypothetical protein
MYDVLYSHQDDLEPGNYDQYAAAVGLDGSALEQAVQDHVYRDAVQRSGMMALSLGADVTPLVALRDNRTGRFLWAVQGDTDVKKAVAAAAWFNPPTTTAESSVQAKT